MPASKIVALGVVVLAVLLSSTLIPHAAEDSEPTSSEQDSFQFFDSDATRYGHAVLQVRSTVTGSIGINKNILPFFEDHCFRCHSGDDPSAGVALDVFESSGDLIQKPELLDAVFRVVREGEMPPNYMPQPSAEEIVTVTRGLDELIAAVEAAMPPRPGRVTLRRLNRVEYENTIRDLLGVEFHATDIWMPTPPLTAVRRIMSAQPSTGRLSPAAGGLVAAGKVAASASINFPSDDVGYGFDNIGDVLSLPPLLMEKYLAAAELIASEAVALTREGVTSPSHRIFIASPSETLSEEEAARRILQRLASRTYRRSVTFEEVDRLISIANLAWEDGDSFEAGIELALTAMLCSPHFLFMVPADPAEATDDRFLNNFELAERLSYFLWSSMPDEELFAEASRGAFREHLPEQVARMLDDPKSKSFVQGFALQWLQLRNLDLASPDENQFPAFDEQLRRSMRLETEYFFNAVLQEDRSVLELIDADFTYVNQPLADLYGISGVSGDEFQRVSLEGTVRGGVLTHAGVLTVTSNPTRTSPVKRGKWIMENILGTSPPDPPANVPMLEEQSQLTGSLREQMEQHRADPNCAICHLEMDQLGFAMENFDVIGSWRDEDGGYPIDASGELPDGRTFTGAVELREMLADSSREKFVRCLTEKVLIYSLGRGIERTDRQYVDRIVESIEEEDYRFSALILGIVQSEPFMKRSGEGR